MRHLVVAEYQKLASTRLWLGLLLAAAAITALYVGLQIAFTADADTWTMPLHTLEGQRTLLASAASAAAPLVAVLGAIGITGEFRHRTATATFLATPHRDRVVIAKLITYASVGTGFAAVSVSVALAIAWPWLAADGIQLQIGDGGNLTTLAGVLAAGGIFGLLGVGVGALVRDQAAAVAGSLVYLFVVEPILTSIGALERWTSYLPGPARAALTGTVISTRTFLDASTGGLVLLAYAVVLAVAGTVLTGRRDIV